MSGLAVAAPALVLRTMAALHAVNSRELLTTGADVLIVFYVVFRILKLVRGTRAAQTMVGMALLSGLYFLAKRLDLFTVSWLFERLIDYFIIFFVVIFQQDLRRALMQVGQNLFTRRQYEETYVIEEGVQAAGQLAKQQVGALIVIERDADLSDHIGEVGIELDARVTKELLVTLFVPEPMNHMHDGAVIIRNLRVQQAGAVLPLSANAKLDKQFGTRHRAAIGITEETDAVVVVVSEERAEVSLCFNGNIASNLEPASLRKALLGLFQKKKNNKGKAPPVAAPRRRPEPATAASVNTDAKTAAASPLRTASPSSGAASSSSAGQVPLELLPLFTTQQLHRPPSPAPLLAPLPTSGPEAVPTPAGAGYSSDDKGSVSGLPLVGEITAPILAAQAIIAAAEQAAEQAAAKSGEALAVAGKGAETR